MLLGWRESLDGILKCHGDREVLDEIIEVQVMLLVSPELLLLGAFYIRRNLDLLIHRDRSRGARFLCVLLDNGLVGVLLLPIGLAPGFLFHMDREDIILVIGPLLIVVV